MRVSRGSAKYLGRTQRAETEHELLQKMAGKMFGQHSKQSLQITRELRPQTSVRTEEETMFYGS